MLSPHSLLVQVCLSTFLFSSLHFFLFSSSLSFWTLGVGFIEERESPKSMSSELESESELSLDVDSGFPFLRSRSMEKTKEVEIELVFYWTAGAKLFGFWILNFLFSLIRYSLFFILNSIFLPFTNKLKSKIQAYSYFF